MTTSSRRRFGTAPAPPTPGSGSLIRTLIEPPGRVRLELRELWRLRATCFVLARRLLKVRYRQTVVGAAWVLIQPLTMMLVFTVFFGILAGFRTGPVPYPVYVFAGMMIWLVVSKMLAEGAMSVVANSALLTKVYFPRAYLPLAVAIGSLVDFGFELIVFGGLLLAFGIIPGWHVVFVPLIVVLVFATALGATFWLSALNAQYRDVTQLLPFLTQVWFFLTPIVYSSTIVPEAFRPLYWLNPIAVAVDSFRWAVAGGDAPTVTEVLVGTIVAVLLLTSGYVFFRSREPAFADVV